MARSLHVVPLDRTVGVGAQPTLASEVAKHWPLALATEKLLDRLARFITDAEDRDGITVTELEISHMRDAGNTGTTPRGPEFNYIDLPRLEIRDGLLRGDLLLDRNRGRLGSDRKLLGGPKLHGTCSKDHSRCESLPQHEKIAPKAFYQRAFVAIAGPLL